VFFARSELHVFYCLFQNEVKVIEKRSTYGGICTKANAPRSLFSTESHPASIAAVSRLIHPATEASTQSGSGADVGPGDQPPGSRRTSMIQLKTPWQKVEVYLENRKTTGSKQA